MDTDDTLAPGQIYLQLSREGQICGCYLAYRAGVPRPWRARERRYMYMTGAARAWEVRVDRPARVAIDEIA